MYKVKLTFPHIICLFILAFNTQCKNTNDSNNIDIQNNDTETHKVTAKDIEQIKYTEYVISDLAEEKTKDWLKFQVLLTHIESLKKGNLSFFKDDKTIMQSFITDLNNEIPEALNATAIIVRLSVIETTMFKLNEISNIKAIANQDILDNIKELLIAHNNLILQINKKVEKDSRNIEKPQ